MKNSRIWHCLKTIQKIIAISLVLMVVPFQGLKAAPEDWSLFLHSELSDEMWMVDAMACKTSVQISLDQSGTAQILPAMLITGPQFPFSEYEVDIMGPLTDIVSCNEIGMEVMAVVEEIPTGNTCMSNLIVQDKLKPLLQCTGDSLPCNVLIDTIQFENYINLLQDNCDNDIDLFYTYTITSVDCNPQNIVAFINVNWTATDDYGNSNSCSDTIFLIKPHINDVVFPNDTTVSCVNADVSPETIGGPTVLGGPIDHTCKLIAWHSDTNIPMCSGMTKILRMWNVMDWCTGQTRTDLQEIIIEDNVPPVVVCPPNENVSTSTLGCFAYYTLLPPVSVTDACSHPDSIEIQIKVSGVPGLFHPGEIVQLPLGIHTITIEAIDDCLNKGTCTYTVDVVDDVSPTFVCSNATLGIGANGETTVQADLLGFNPMDNCGVDRVEIARMTDQCNNPSNLVFDNEITLCCEDVGDSILVLYKVTDINGNMNTCMFGIGVKDALPPVAMCKDITLSIDNQSSVSVTVNDVDNGSTDNCLIVSRVVTPNSFDCDDIGDQIVTLTVTDESGNTDECNATVTVKDTLPPNAVCNNLVRTLNNMGIVTITATEVDGGSTDNCGLDTIYISQDQFGCNDLGDNPVTLTVVDDFGNTDECIAIITIQELPPDANCKDTTVELDAAGMGSITANDVNDNSTDDCGINTLEVNPNTFECSDFGDNSVTLIVTDFSGNVDSCSANVKVKDLLGPTCVTQDITVFLDQNGSASFMSSDIDNGSSDNCSNLTFMAVPMSFNCDSIGDRIVSLTVTDLMGNMSTCTATVTVKDTVAPVCSPSNTTVYLDVNGNASIVAADVNNNSSDNCSIDNIAVDPNAFTCMDAGNNVNVTLTVTDIAQNSSTCIAVVTVLDTIPPPANCMDITRSLDGNGAVNITVFDISIPGPDNCGIASSVLNNTSFNCNDLGANAVTLTVTDINSNVATCQATVTIEDNTDPNAVCQNISVMLDANGMASITPQDIDGGTTDNCSFILSATPLTFTCNDVGMQPVLLTATDPSNNTDDCTAMVDVMENELPNAICQNITVYLDGGGNASIVASDVDGGSTDNCGNVNLSIDPSTFNCSDIGTNPVILTVMDDFGNTDTCTAIVTVLDTISPTALCVPAFDLPLDMNGNASITVNDIDNNSTDNCPPVNTSIDLTSFDCSDIGINTVTLTVTDGSLNDDQCTTNVNVIDTLPPDANCVDITVSLGPNAMITIVPGDVDGGSSDNCSFVLTASPLTFTCDNVGDNMVELIATDPSNNADTCIAIVTVDEVVNLVAVCQNIEVQLDANGNASIIPSDIDAGSTSSCDVPDLSIDINSFNCNDVGPNQVVLTATVGMNSDTCNAIVTVVDNQVPDAVCQDVTIYLDGAGSASIIAADVDGGSTDNCPFTTSVDISSFDCDDTGDTNVILTVTDNSNNSGTCNAVVTVLDTIAPTCVTNDFTVSLDGNGNAMITVNDVNAGSTDNCTPITFGLTPTSFTCNELGDNVVNLSAQDPSGNTSSCTATVTVIDESNLVANCQNITVFLNSNGMVSITPDDIDTGSGGGCTGSGISLSLDEMDFNCDDIGMNTVTLTVTDQDNNTATCTATVTVVDNMSPDLTCPPNVQLNCNDVIDLSDLSQFGDPIASDNCGIPLVTEAIVINLDNCGVGNVIRTFTATDGTNPSVQCSQTLSIINPDPFSVNDISFPPALIELTDCASTLPDDIPDSQPTVTLSPQTCSQVGISFEDSDITTTVDNDPFTPCLSLTRTWTIIDTCQLEPGTTNGIFTFVQTITVNDFSPPVFDPIQDIVVIATEDNCEVFVPLVASATDCSNITYTNDSPFGATDGADASGMYPFGNTLVTFTATDECGNSSVIPFQVMITVVEEEPSQFQCIKYVVDLPGELEVTIHAREFVNFIPGTCSTIDDFFFSYDPDDPNDSLRVFDCSDVGVTTRNLWFYNEFGIKVDSCNNADLELRDVTDLCMDGFTIEGEIESEEGFAVNETEVMIEEMAMEPAMTSQSGSYIINGLSNEGGYTVKPSKDYNDTEGVSTLDLVMMQKHLLGIKPLTSPYKIIAADINKSGRVTGIDLLELRKLLLGIYTEFPENESWRFVDAAFDFPDPYNPFMTEFPESVHFDSLFDQTTILDFIGVKIGDVNGSFFNFNQAQVKTRGAQAFIRIEDQKLGSNWIEIPVFISNLESAIGFQFELRFDDRYVADWEVKEIADLFDADHIQKWDDRIRFSWNDVHNVALYDKQLFTIRVKGTNDLGNISDGITVQQDILIPEAYTEKSNSFEIRPIDIEWLRPDQDESGYALFQNRPNPFRDETMIGFSLPKSSEVLIRVFDSGGRQIFEKKGDYTSGMHHLIIGNNVLNIAGVYYYSILTPEFTATRKMILRD